MPPGFLPRSRRTCRTAPWLLATLTLALALAGPAYADSLGAEEIQEAEAMLAAEVPDEPIEAPPEPPEPVVEPAEAAPSEPAPAPVEAPEPEPPAPSPVEEAVTSGPTESAEPGEPAEPDLTEEVATEPPAYISDEEGPGMPHEDEAAEVDEEDADAGAPPVVLPVNLNVDIRILSPGDDGDVTQVIDLGGLPGLGSGNPSDVLGGLGFGDLDLGLDWTWNWNWTWDCGDASVAGLDWNWTWTWSGDCAAGIFDEPGHGYRPGQGSLGDRFPDMLDAVSRDALRAPSELADEPWPLVSTPGAGGRSPARARTPERDNAHGAPAPAAPTDGGPWSPSGAPTSFVSTGATSQPNTATAPPSNPAGADPNGDPERPPAGSPSQTMGLATAAGSGGGGGALSVLLLAALVGALALLPPPPGGRVSAISRKLSSLLSSSRLERPG